MYSGNSRSLGSFVTPQEAALAIARHLAQEGVATRAAAPATSEPMSSEEAEAAAARAGLRLARSDKSSTGFVGVTDMKIKGRSRPFHAMARCVSLGCFATAAEAALVRARHVAEQEGMATPASYAGAQGANVPRGGWSGGGG